MRRRWLRRVLLAALLLLAGLVAGAHLWAYWHYREAQKALGRREFAAAQQHLTQCLAVWTRSTAVHLEAARAARKAGAYDEAERLLRCYRDLGGDPEASDVERLLLRVQRGELAWVEGPLVGRVLQDHPDSVLILEVLAVAYYQTYQLAKAQECLRRWLEYEPDRPEAWLLRARVCQRLNNSGEALASYRRVVELDPDNDEARLEVAEHLARRNQPEQALAEFEYLRRRLGDTPAVLKGMACCRRALNQPDEARRLLEAVLAEAPRDWRALTERGHLALTYESAEEAEKWFRRAVAAAPYERDPNYGLSQCLARLGKHQEADAVLSQLKRAEADLARLADLSRAIGRTPDDPALRCEAGQILIRWGLKAEGLRWLESALAVDPTHAGTHQALADYFRRSGDSERAARHRRLAQGGGSPPAGKGGRPGP